MSVRADLTRGLDGGEADCLLSHARSNKNLARTGTGTGTITNKEQTTQAHASLVFYFHQQKKNEAGGVGVGHFVTLRTMLAFLHKVIKLIVVVAVVSSVDGGSSDLGGSQRGLAASLLLGLQGILGRLLLLVGKSCQSAGKLADINITGALGKLTDKSLQERNIQSLFLICPIAIVRAHVR